MRARCPFRYIIRMDLTWSNLFMDGSFLIVVILTPNCLSRNCVEDWYKFVNNNVRLPKEAAETFRPLAFLSTTYTNPHTHTPVHSYTQTPTHPHTHTPTHPHTHTPTHPHTHTPTPTHTHTHTYTHTNTHTHTHTHTQTHTYTNTNTHTHTHTHKHKHALSVSYTPLR